MKKGINYLLIILILLSVNDLFGQSEIRIKGIITDSESEKVMPYVNIILMNLEQTETITGNISDENGQFIFSGIPKGIYVLKISHIGFLTKEISIDFDDQSLIDLGIIYLNRSVVELPEVNVTASKQVLEAEPGKRTLNIEQDISSVGGTAIDVMNNLPSVDVDMDNNVLLRGRKATIFIDGVETLFEDALDQIPSSAISSVEVITNPSAKYDSKSGAGIINIKLKKQKQKGYIGKVSSGYDTSNDYFGYFQSNIRINKIGMATSCSGKVKSSKGEGVLNSDIMKTPLSFIERGNRSEKNTPSKNYRVAANYFINKNNLMSLSFQYRDYVKKSLLEDISSKLDENHSLIQFTNSNRDEKIDSDLKKVALDFKRTFKKKKHELLFHAEYSGNDVFKGIDKEKQSFYPDSSLKGDKNLDKHDTKESKELFIIKLDCSVPLFKNNLLETGYKLNIRRNGANYEQNNFDFTFNEWERDSIRSNIYEYDENIHGLYAMYSGSLRKLEYQVGARIEKVNLSPQAVSTDTTYNNDFFEFLPSLQLNYRYSKKQNFQFSYSKRSTYPSYYKLNPYEIHSNPYNIRSGNPLLKPESIHSFELSNYLASSIANINSSIFYKKIDEIIGKMSFIDDDGITHSTQENLSDGYSYGMELIISKKFFTSCNVKLNLTWYNMSLNYNRISFIEKREKSSGIAKLLTNFNLYDNKIQFTAKYDTPKITWQGTTYKKYSFSLGIKRAIFDDKINVTVKVDDLFDTLVFEKSITNKENFYSFQSNKLDTRRLLLNISYKFSKRKFGK